MALLQRIIMTWLAAWMLAVPLVHIHPEADHQHGQASHIHGGLTHSVFSADLPCEYHSSSPSSTPSVAGQSAHDYDHPEIGFTLLVSSPDRDTGKPVLSGVLSEGAAAVPIQPSRRNIIALTESAAPVVLTVHLSTRAPPASA